MRQKTLYQVRDVLQRVRISRNTLYNWERRGRIPMPKRNVSGYRVYTEKEVRQIEKFKNMLFVHEPIVRSKP